MQITYQKRDGNIIQRYRNTVLPYKIGEETSMGWKVLNIEYEYNMLIHKKKQTCIKRQLAREVYIKELKNLLYCIIAVLVINFIKALIGM